MWVACGSPDDPSGPPAPPPAPVKLAFQDQQNDGEINRVLPAFKVALLDSAGRLVPLSGVGVAVKLAGNPDATLSGTLTASTKSGVAEFPGLLVDQPAAAYRLVASAAGMTDDTSAEFTVLPPRDAALSFGAKPLQTVAGVVMTPIEVYVRDPAGALLTGVRMRVSLSLTSNGTSATLVGTTTVTAVGGIARFPDLFVSDSGSGVTLKASAFGLPDAMSQAFDVKPRVPFRGAAIATSDWSTCALDNSGAAWCWGRNLYGQLGEGREVSIPQPHAVSGPMFSQLSATQATWHGEISQPWEAIACGLTPDGTAYCWGGGEDNPFNGNDASSPQPVAGAPTFAAITTGLEYACGLTPSGSVWCWGVRKPFGQGSAIEQLATNLQFEQLVSSDNVSCGITAGGTGAAYCWGRGYLGNETTQQSATPLAVAGNHTFSSISLGNSHACGLDREGAAWCWGGDWSGQVGNDTSFATSLVPVRVQGQHRFVALSAGGFYTCALTAEGQAWCWGSNWNGQFGDGSAQNNRYVPVEAASGHTFTGISAGLSHTCALTASGEAWCWGLNRDGQVGNGTWSDSRTPVRVLGGQRFASISAGGDYTCGVTTTGASRCWGDNTWGQLGDQHPLFKPVPLRVLGGHKFATLTAGGDGICGLTADHETWCWGVVRDRVEKRSRPLRLTDDPGFRVLSFGRAGGCGIDQGDAAWCWGYVLGNGSKNGTSQTPVRISSGLSVAAISVGDHACALTTDGDAYCWGPRVAPAGTDFSVPVLVGGGLNFVAISSGSGHDCGLTAIGEAYCWGRNFYGALGDGTRTDSPTPRLVQGGLHFSAISVGEGMSCGLTGAGDVFCWGHDPNNQGYATPTLIPGGIKFATIEVSSSWGSHTCGIATNGELYCWGGNQFGQLGNGAKSEGFTTTPTLVMGLSTQP